MLKLDYHLPDVNVTMIQSVEVPAPEGHINIMVGVSGYDNSFKFGTEWMHKKGQLLTNNHIREDMPNLAFRLSIAKSYTKRYRALFVFHRGSLFVKIFKMNDSYKETSIEWDDPGVSLFLSGIEISLLRKELKNEVIKERRRLNEYVD